MKIKNIHFHSKGLNFQYACVSQGQTRNFVGIYLPQPGFSHGQLYVALSKVRTASDLKLLIKHDVLNTFNSSYNKNIVYEEILLRNICRS